MSMESTVLRKKRITSTLSSKRCTRTCHTRYLTPRDGVLISFVRKHLQEGVVKALNVGLNVKLATGYNNGVMDINGQIYSGETRSSGILLGNQGHGWQMGQLNAELYQYLPYHTSLQLKTGAQYATGQTPEQEYFILGGEWRGDSYYAGQAATPSGIYGGVRFFTPRIRTNTGWLRTFSAHPFIGVNGAEGTPMVGGRLETASVDIGSKFKLTKYLFGETGYAWSIDNQGPHIPKGRLFFTLTGNYI